MVEKLEAGLERRATATILQGWSLAVCGWDKDDHDSTTLQLAKDKYVFFYAPGTKVRLPTAVHLVLRTHKSEKEDIASIASKWRFHPWKQDLEMVRDLLHRVSINLNAIEKAKKPEPPADADRIERLIFIIRHRKEFMELALSEDPVDERRGIDGLMAVELAKRELREKHDRRIE